MSPRDEGILRLAVIPSRNAARDHHLGRDVCRFIRAESFSLRSE
jgi:hypothetical protein